MLISKKNRREVYKYLFKGAPPGAPPPPPPLLGGAGASRPIGVSCCCRYRRHCHPPAEGVLYAEKDYNLPKHPEIDVPNLEVIKLMQVWPVEGGGGWVGGVPGRGLQPAGRVGCLRPPVRGLPAGPAAWRTCRWVCGAPYERSPTHPLHPRFPLPSRSRSSPRST